MLALQAAGLFAKPKLPLLLFGWLSMWLRGGGWRQIGLCRPRSWLITVATAVGVGLAYNALDIRVILPLLQRITGQAVDLGDFGSLQGNTSTLLLLLAVSWISAAFPE